ncbi:MAG TPA: TldD/PmbA family protein [Alphaproteobacteria bacterium]|nr:TldD/PmbA family protein [Alphaproteobacteria bacterium]
MPQSDRTSAEALDLLATLLARAKRAGADAADALFVESAALSHAQRLGNVEKLERAESRDLGLRVLIGRRQAIVSSSDQDEKALAALVERAIAMARVVPEDPFCGLAPEDRILREVPALDICDEAEPAPETLIERARACEEAARAVAGITNSEGAEAGWSLTRVALAATNGFAGGYRRSYHSLGVAVVAGEGTAMERDYDFSTAVYGAELEAPAVVGRSAGEKAVKRLNPKKLKTTKAPVIYDPRASNGILGHLASAINGSAVARGTSFLKDKLGAAVLPPGMRVVDDPLRARGQRSRPFDGEGIPTAKRNFVEDGVLASWLLDLRTARRLGLETTGHASRGTSAPPEPSPTNLYLEPGVLSPAALIKETGRGLYVTELIGFGVNGVTGDYSRGAAGFWIEDGTLAYPVSEITIAGNLKDMFLALTAADDLVFRYGTNAPTLRIAEMTIAGA